MNGTERVRQLSSMVNQRNAIDNDIATLIGRPAHLGHIGEFVAATIFDIDLFESAVTKGCDGLFSSGRLKGRSVDIKYMSTESGLLNMTLEDPPDFYLALTGPRVAASSSRGTSQPWTIAFAFLFDASDLVRRLQVKIGVATSIRRQFWDAAEIFPSANNPMFHLTSEQRSMLEMFAA